MAKMINLLIRFPEGTKNKLEIYCNKRNISQASACRIAITKFLEKENVA